MFSEEGRYSEDYAVFIPSDMAYCIQLCMRCLHVTAMKRAKAFGFIKLPGFVLDRTMPIEAFLGDPLGSRKDPQIGGQSSMHLMRIAWQSLLAQSELDVGSKDKKHALHLAMDKFNPPIVAGMMFAAAHAAQLVPLEQQLEEGAYLMASDQTLRKSEIQQWISEHPDKKKREAVLEWLSGYQFDPMLS